MFGCFVNRYGHRAQVEMRNRSCPRLEEPDLRYFAGVVVNAAYKIRKRKTLVTTDRFWNDEPIPGPTSRRLFEIV